ncbi:hypothetical protein DPMN_001554 [Dreissena polymorpha]|uniref:Uncharacterized protein n=1 Tax=Dreissena polymorpha TaxID=45954 RepID=A0A9D4RSZ6_DREPO|nr:hypothetical protein DPMN_001554 [Dreissena polymorpha]
MLLIVNCILLALVCPCAAKPCSEDTESEETSSGCESSSHGTDSDDRKVEIVINIKDCSSSSSCQEDTPCSDGCPDCSVTDHAQCNETTKQCECKFDGEFPNCCPDCSAVDGQICCIPGVNCGSANVGECFCENGEIPKENGPIECCLVKCPDGEACGEDGVCKPTIPFGKICVDDGVRSSNACDQRAGIKCHTYDCCGQESNIDCRDKYCLCETPQGWEYNNATVPCKFVGGRPDKKLCLDAPDDFGSPTTTTSTVI